MSSHENRESRFDEPPEPDRPIPQAGVPDDADPKHSPEGTQSAAGHWHADFESSPVAGRDDTHVNDGDDDTADESEEIDLFSGPGEDEAISIADRWDANDPRRKNDSFAPPTEPCECHCLHCGRTFSSQGIWFQKVINDPQGFDGFWMCPTPNCSGAGFTFDIFPTDPDHPANEGWHYDDDEDDEFDDEDEESDTDDSEIDSDWSELEPDADDDNQEYDPAEPQYADMDLFCDDSDDLEGEEWKLGLQPGERPPEPAWREDARREWEEDQKRYDEPDQRPRILDWSDREDRRDEHYNKPRDGKFSDDDIPF
ncbi:hypothetical protein [Humisphaera borealis]|uniref:Uncharacterized protein n=1 Tax=Humisphaera borealis TaxID=2807512 RepID=A0A7M2X2P2_9BACT|nr:hypothetical protein [Humisphaera borealis]QOV91944.1 hypothetical protein IPV69_11555 [Humisphaera borealis]